MSQQKSTTAPSMLPVLDANVTAGMCLTTLKGLGRESMLVGNRGVVVGVADKAQLAELATTPGAGNRPLRDVAQPTGLVWL